MSLIKQSQKLNPFAYQPAEGINESNFTCYKSPTFWLQTNPACHAYSYIFIKNGDLIDEKNDYLDDIRQMISGMIYDLYNNGGGNELYWKIKDKFYNAVANASFKYLDAMNLNNLLDEVLSHLNDEYLPIQGQESKLGFYLEILITNFTYYTTKVVSRFLPEARAQLENVPAND